MKNLANIITVLRMVFAAVMVFAAPFSVLFWVCYVCCGLSDIIDGPVARALHRQSDTGARLDSIADMVFALAIAIVAVMYIAIPLWLWLGAAAVAVLRLAGYGIGYCKFKTFSSLHTYLNKAVGGLIFAFPLLYFLLGMTVTGIILCAAAALSAAEELVITIRSKELNRDVKGLLFR